MKYHQKMHENHILYTNNQVLYSHVKLVLYEKQFLALLNLVKKSLYTKTIRASQKNIKNIIFYSNYLNCLQYFFFRLCFFLHKNSKFANINLKFSLIIN